MVIKKLTHFGVLVFPLVANADNNSFTVSVANSIIVNDMRLVYGGNIEILLVKTNFSVSEEKLFYEIVLITSVDINTGIVTTDITNYELFLSGNAIATFNLIGDGLAEFNGLNDIYSGEWLWGSIDMYFSELLYSFTIYN